MFTTKRSYIALLLMFLCGFLTTVRAQTASEPLTLSVIPGIPFNGFGVSLLTEVYARLGLSIKVAEIPPLREELMLEQGLLDGVVIKVESVDNTPPELIKVPVVIAEIPITIFVKGADIGLQNLLSKSPLRFGILRGLDYDLNLPVDIEWVRVNKPQQLMMMLSNGRVDAVVTAESVGKYYIKTYNLDDIAALKPAIQTLAIYHYLHQRHRDLVPKVAAVMQSMVDDGSLQKRAEAYHAELLQDTVNAE